MIRLNYAFDTSDVKISRNIEMNLEWWELAEVGFAQHFENFATSIQIPFK